MDSDNIKFDLNEIRGTMFKRLMNWAQEDFLNEDAMRHSMRAVQIFKTCQRTVLEELTKAADAFPDDKDAVDPEYLLYAGKSGWDCGLGQMLDLNEKIVCKTLPYILTAYMYNYNLPRKDFVRKFATEHEFSMAEDEFFGIKEYSVSDTGELYGIGNLLAGEYTIEGYSAYDTLDNLAKLFTFSGVAVYSWGHVTNGQHVNVRGYFNQPYVFPTAYGKGRNMAAAEQRIAYTEINGQDVLPPIGDDSFTYGMPRDISSVENALDRLHHDLADFKEKLKSAYGEERRKMKEYFLCLSYTLSQIKDAMSELQTETDEADDALNDLAGKYNWKRSKYTKPQNQKQGKLPNFSGGMSLDAILNIFATWYHIWKANYNDTCMACRVDPVLCVLLLKKTLPQEEAPSFEDVEKALSEMEQEAVCLFIDELIEAQYRTIANKDEEVPPRWTLKEFMEFFPEPRYPIPNLTTHDR